jgi:PIN like domain
MNVDIVPKRDHPYLSKRSTRAFKAITKELEDSCKAMEKLVGSDPYADRMFDIFEDRVGKAPTTEALGELEATAQTRYGKLIPPGFADVKEKGLPAACGDFIVWHQLMEIAKEEEKGVILVTDDLKEDWWLLEGSRTVGPLPDLIEEFTRVTNQHFYMYNSETFLRAAREFAAADIRDDVIEEVTERRASASAALRSAPVKSVPAERENLRVKKRVPEPLSGSDVKQSPAPIADNQVSAEKLGPRRD